MSCLRLFARSLGFLEFLSAGGLGSMRFDGGGWFLWRGFGARGTAALGRGHGVAPYIRRVRDAGDGQWQDRFGIGGLIGLDG